MRKTKSVCIKNECNFENMKIHMIFNRYRINNSIRTSTVLHMILNLGKIKPYCA
ncbi:hypothetical protein Hanom_Chr15g01371851 [Helianthus anomalus]